MTLPEETLDAADDAISETNAPMPRAIGAKQFASTFAVNLVIQGCTIIQGVLLARVLGPEGRGQFAGAILWPSVFAGVGGLGMGIALARRAARVTDLRPVFRAGLVLALATGLTATVACAAALPWLLADVDAATRAAAWWFLPFIVFNHAALTLIAIDHGAGRFAQYNWTRVLINPLYLAMIGALWLAGERSAAWYVGALAMATAIVATVRVGTALRYTRGFGAVESLPGVFREALPFGAAGLLNPVLSVADKALLLYVLGETQLGLYAVALAAASALSSLSQAAAAVSFGMSTQGEDAAAFQRVARVFRFTAWTWVLGGVALGAAMPVLLPLVYGPAFAGAVWPAIVLIAAVALAGQASILEDAMRGQGRAFVGLEARIAGMGLFLAVGWWATRQWGVVGAAAAYALGQAVVLAVMIVMSRRHLPASGVRVLVPQWADLRELIVRLGAGGAQLVAGLRHGAFGSPGNGRPAAPVEKR